MFFYFKLTYTRRQCTRHNRYSSRKAVTGGLYYIMYGICSEDGNGKQEIHNLCCSPDMIRVNKSRRIRWEGHAMRRRKDECCLDAEFGWKI
jgi:hypothetical protein